MNIFEIFILLQIILSVNFAYEDSESTFSGQSFTYSVLKPRFEKEFLESCTKYHFVRQYYDRFDGDGYKKYVEFVFQQDDYKNGGLGDRLAGIINAMDIALRFNRTLLIKSSNGFEKLFRPYIPLDKLKSTPDILENYSYNHFLIENYNESVLDLTGCLNSPPDLEDQCNVVLGDPSEQIIRLQGNRVYLCRLFKLIEKPAYSQFMNGIRIENPVSWMNVNGFDHNIDWTSKLLDDNIMKPDLIEVGGCMLRLAVWPTDLLWSLIDEAFEKFKLSLINRGMSEYQRPFSWKKIISLHFRCGDAGYDGVEDYEFECIHSVSKLYMNVSSGLNETIWNFPPHTESAYMGFGTPFDLADCSEKVLTNLTSQYNNSEYNTMFSDKEFKDSVNLASSTEVADESLLRLSYHESEKDSKTDDIIPFQQLREHHLRHHNRLHRLSNQSFLNNQMMRHQRNYSDFRTIVYIASDNIGSITQLNETLNWPTTFISPPGCHIEKNSSYECLKMTVTYWMIMALSEIIITPTHYDGTPNSGFSRYASFYGLKEDSLRNPTNCDHTIPRRDQSHMHQGNWLCH